jgi:hypothetical protein
MTAGVGEDGGRHAAPIVPAAAPDALRGAPDTETPDAVPPDAEAREIEDEEDAAGTDPSQSSVTQALPMIRREGAGESASVRAVARRVPSALPALGREEITDVPLSARTTAQRRRQAAADARAGATVPDGSTADLEVSADEPVAEAAEPVAEVHEPEVGAAAPVAELPERGPEMAKPVVEPVSETVRSVELVIEPLPPAESEAARFSAADGEARRGPAESEAARFSAADGEARRGPAEAVPVIAAIPRQMDRRADLEPAAAVALPGLHDTPVSRGGQVTATQLMGQPAPASGGDVLEAEIVDDPPPSRASVNAAAAEVLSTLTEVAFREARTDEWIMGRPEPVREPSTAVERVRPGPGLIKSDSWDTGLLPVVQQDTYQGRRRAATVGGRLWLVISLVVAALVTAIAIPFMLTSNETAPTAARTPDGQIPNVENSGTSSPASPTPSSGPGLPVVGASPLNTASPTPSTSPSPAPFLAIIEAEAGGSVTKWSESTAVKSSLATASGGFVIDRIGEWGRPDGYLEVTVTVPSAGTYQLAVSYLFLASNGDTTRRVRITITYPLGASPASTQMPDVIFNRVTVCCAVQNINVTLANGTNKIRFTHPGVRSPAIDKIVITKA